MDKKSIMEAVRTGRVSVRSANLMLKQLRNVENLKNVNQNTKTAA